MDNKPSPEELRTCQRFLDRERVALDLLKLVVVLGTIAMDDYLAARQIRGVRFGHSLLYANLDRPLFGPAAVVLPPPEPAEHVKQGD